MKYDTIGRLRLLHSVECAHARVVTQQQVHVRTHRSALARKERRHFTVHHPSRRECPSRQIAGISACAVAPAAELLELHPAIAPTFIKLIYFLKPAALLTKSLLHAIHQDGGHPHVFSAYAIPLEIGCMSRIYGCASNNKALHRKAALVPIEAALELNDGQVAGV